MSHFPKNIDRKLNSKPTLGKARVGVRHKPYAHSDLPTRKEWREACQRVLGRAA